MTRNAAEKQEDTAIVRGITHPTSGIRTLFGPDPVIVIHTNQGDMHMRVHPSLHYEPDAFEGELLSTVISIIQAEQRALERTAA